MRAEEGLLYFRFYGTIFLNMEDPYQYVSVNDYLQSDQQQCGNFQNLMLWVR